jgi:hypothetical protein
LWILLVGFSILALCRFDTFFRYVLSAAVIGSAYTLLVLPFAAIHVAQGRRIGRGRGIALLIFTDVVSINSCTVWGGTGEHRDLQPK